MSIHRPTQWCHWTSYPVIILSLLLQQSDQLYALQHALLVSHAKFLIEEETIHDSRFIISSQYQ